MSVSLWQEERLIFIIWDVLDEDAAETIGRKPDNNVFITRGHDYKRFSSMSRCSTHNLCSEMT